MLDWIEPPFSAQNAASSEPLSGPSAGMPWAASRFVTRSIDRSLDRP